VSFGGRLHAGRHRLIVRAGPHESSSVVLSAPRRMPGVAEPTWGVFAPVHALRSRDDWGVGSFGDLGTLQGAVTSRGGGVVGTLPMFASFLDEPFEPSPYSPASRLYWNELFVDVERAPGLADAPEARAALDEPAVRGAIARLRAEPLVDHRAAMAAKRRVLEPLAERSFRSGTPQLVRHVEAHPGLRDYARFRAEVDRRRVWWGEWPAAQRDGRLNGAADADPDGRYHLYAQWLATSQLDALRPSATAAGGLELDLPLGVNGAGYDVWRNRHLFALDASAGAPPDTFFTGGQDWGFAPLHPDRIREDGYEYPMACVRTVLRYASVLRIDHVMSLHRLFWIPHGMHPADGVYIRYRPDEWYAALSIEAHRSGAAVVGEDLGTVPTAVRRAMARHRVHRSYVAQYEARPDATEPLPPPPAASLASVNTHDMPPWAQYWNAGDLELARELGLLGDEELLSRREDRRAVLEAVISGLVADGLLDPADRRDPGAVHEAVLMFLARSDAAVVLATLEDLWLEDRPQNVPGTGPERPNWRGRLRWTVEEIADRPEVATALSRLAEARRRVRA
jgi:4-alpha-glucanotransferase